MTTFTIRKADLSNDFVGVNAQVLGQAAGELKLCGLKLFLYLANNKNGYKWGMNPVAYATWLGMDYTTQGRAVRKAITDGTQDLLDNGYLREINKDNYEFLEQKVPKI